MNPPEQSEGPYELNATAVIEYVYEFFRFVYEVLAPCANPGRWTFRVIATGWKSLRGGLRLAPGLPDRFRAWPEEAQLASGDRLEDEIEGTGSPGRDAFTALGRLYGLFGLPPTDIPYTASDAMSVELLPK